MAAKSAPDGYTIGLGGIASHAIAPTGIDAPIEVKSAPLSTNFVEHPEVVADRIARVADVVGDPRRVLAGTDCGFDTFAGRGRVAGDVAWAKLRALRDGARLASERLFGGTDRAAAGA